MKKRLASPAVLPTDRTARSSRSHKLRISDIILHPGRDGAARAQVVTAQHDVCQLRRSRRSSDSSSLSYLDRYAAASSRHPECYVSCIVVWRKVKRARRRRRFVWRVTRVVGQFGTLSIQREARSWQLSACVRRVLAMVSSLALRRCVLHQLRRGLGLFGWSGRWQRSRCRMGRCRGRRLVRHGGLGSGKAG